MDALTVENSKVPTKLLEQLKPWAGAVCGAVCAETEATRARRVREYCIMIAVVREYVAKYYD